MKMKYVHRTSNNIKQEEITTQYETLGTIMEALGSKSRQANVGQIIGGIEDQKPQDAVK